MVDRYLLPIPKTKNFRMYMRFKNKPLHFFTYTIGVLLFCFQLNRLLALRTVISNYIICRHVANLVGTI